MDVELLIVESLDCWIQITIKQFNDKQLNKKGTVLGETHQAYRLAVVAVVVLRIEVAAVEVHAVRVVAIVVRTRPVVAVGTDIVDRSPVAVACGRQEDRCTRRQLSFASCQKNLSWSQWHACLFPFQKAQLPMNYPFLSVCSLFTVVWPSLA